MFHLDNNSGVSAMPPVGTVQSSAPRWFTEGGGGTPASYPGAAWYNIIQAELLNFLSAYGIAPDKADLSQLQKAIEAAIKEKATAKSPLLTAIAALVTSADRMPYFNGKDTVAMTALTAFAREVLAQTGAAGVLSKLGVVKQTGPFDATAGSLLINGAWGWGGKGQSITMSTTDFLTWCRTGTNGSGVFRNDTVTPHSIQFGTGLLVRAGNTWGAITFGYEEVGNTGVRITAGNEAGTATATYNLWTDKNLANPATLDTAQTISGQKIFQRAGTILVGRQNTTSDSNYVAGQDPSGTNLWFVGKTDNGVNTRTVLANIVANSHVWLKPDGNIKLRTGGSGNVYVRNMAGTEFQVLSQGNNAVADANGLWKTPESPALTPASIGALSITELAGIPLPYPGAVAPAGFLKCNGQAFNATLYPILAARYPSGNLPDLRAEFIRGWDDGREVDTGRVLLSAQGDAIRNITATRNGVAEWTSGEDIGAFSTEFNNDAQLGSGTGFCRWGNLSFDASRVVPTASENRPRNIAFNYIVRAA